jgi:hypothetical protein
MLDVVIVRRMAEVKVILPLSFCHGEKLINEF